MRVVVACLLCWILGSAAAQPPSTEVAIQGVLDGMVAAWNRGDAAALANHVEADILFTLLDGSVWEGRDVFESKHRGIFAGAFKGTTMAFRARHVKLLRPDVAVVDVDSSLSPVSPEASHTSLLLVLRNHDGQWRVAAFHNTARRSLN